MLRGQYTTVMKEDIAIVKGQYYKAEAQSSLHSWKKFAAMIGGQWCKAEAKPILN
jgi:hypothetical protein